MKYILTLLFAILLLASKAQTTITADQAKDNVGKTVTITDKVVSTYRATNKKGSPTFLDFGGKYPNYTLEVVIWVEDLPKFSFSPATLIGKTISVTGTIKLYNGKPEIVAKNSNQIKI